MSDNESTLAKIATLSTHLAAIGAQPLTSSWLRISSEVYKNRHETLAHSIVEISSCEPVEEAICEIIYEPIIQAVDELNDEPMKNLFESNEI